MSDTHQIRSGCQTPAKFAHGSRTPGSQRHREVRHPPNSFGSQEVRHPPISFGEESDTRQICSGACEGCRRLSRAHAAGAGTIRVHQAAADINSSAVLLGFSFEREHRPDCRMAFGKRPFPCKIGPNAQDEMDMVAHDGITADIDSGDGGKLLEPLADPFLAVLVTCPDSTSSPQRNAPRTHRATQ
jgi:hypothetical protein